MKENSPQIKLALRPAPRKAFIPLLPIILSIRLRKAWTLFLPLALHLSLALTLISCSSAQKNFDTHLAAGRCDEALERIPEESSGIKLVSKTKQAAGTALSYSLTGVSYTAELIWDVAGGTITFVALCGPMIALVAASGGAGPAVIGSMEKLNCLPGNPRALSSPPLGRNMYESTKDLRCPDLAPLARSMRKIASCYKQRGDEASIKKAQATLGALRSSGDFYSCLPRADQDLINQDIEELKSPSTAQFMPPTPHFFE